MEGEAADRHTPAGAPERPATPRHGHPDQDPHSSRPDKGRIGTLAGIPGLSLDALTSVAYGPEAIVLVLAGAGASTIPAVRPITLAIVVLLAILVFSYRQVIAAYPDGGGAYAVSKVNLGRGPSLLAAASLVVDYVLTVAVSVTAGVAALTSAFPGLTSATVPLCLAILVVITALNLFGLSESAKAFALPTAVFIGGLYLVVVAGLVHPFGHATSAVAPARTTGTLGVLLILKAFASGCSALTGVEAIANGTPTFKDPSVRRAQRTELLLGFILGTLLLGLAQLTVTFHLRPEANVTLLSQITDRAVGHGVAYYVVQLSTTLALALAANTSFGGLPVLGGLLARDGFLPRIFSLHGERPVYRYGVVVLAVLAAVLLVASGGNTNTLLPLFAIGVFIGFTLAQVGLVRHWASARVPWWWARATLNGTGALLSAAAAIIFLASKFVHGGFVIVVVVPALILLFTRIHRYYDRMRRQLGVDTIPPRPSREGPARGVVVVPVVGISRLTAEVLGRALGTGAEVHAVHVAFDGEPTDELVRDWAAWDPGVGLEVLHSRQRSVVRAMLDYLSSPELAAHDSVTVLIGEVEPRRLRHRLLLNQRGALLATVLRRRTDAIVATIPFRLE